MLCVPRSTSSDFGSRAAAAVGVRVPVEHETEGLDIVLHNETGYNF